MKGRGERQRKRYFLSVKSVVFCLQSPVHVYVSVSVALTGKLVDSLLDWVSRICAFGPALLVEIEIMNTVVLLQTKKLLQLNAPSMKA
jgi:hypothetical protein